MSHVRLRMQSYDILFIPWQGYAFYCITMLYNIFFCTGSRKSLFFFEAIVFFCYICKGKALPEHSSGRENRQIANL